MSKTPEEYSRRVYAAPFGRWEGNRPAHYPANEVLLGRERERSRMLDWLLALGSRGAYLVTGYRGVGKTSFINYSLRSYEEDVYGRYQQSRVGRAIWWDRVLVTVGVSLALLVPVFASQFAHLVYVELSAQRGGSQPLLLVVCFLLALIAAYPLAYAWSLLKIASGLGRGRGAVMLAQQLVFVVTCLLLPLAAPELSAASLLALLGWTTFANRAFSVSVETELRRDPGAEGFASPTRRVRITATAAIVGGSLAIVLWGYLQAYPEQVFGQYLTFATASVVAAITLRICDVAVLASFLKRSPRIQNVRRTQVRTIIASVGTLAALAAVIGFGVVASWPESWPFLGWFSLIWGAELALAATARAVLCRERVRQHHAQRARASADTRKAGPLRFSLQDLRVELRARPIWFAFHPRPRLLIALKALFCLALGVQLLLPALQSWLARSLSPLLSTFGSGLGSDHSSLLRAASSASWFGPFRGLEMELHWLAVTLLFVLYLHYLEHDWVIRRHERARRDDAYDPARWNTPNAGARSKAARSKPDAVEGIPVAAGASGRPPSTYAGARTRMELLQLTNDLMRATSFYWIYQTWLPLITVRINLGFDELSHTQVVTAMLAGLRDEYRRKFISLRSRLGFLSSSLLFVAVVAIGMAAGEWLSESFGVVGSTAMLCDRPDSSSHSAPQHLYGYALSQRGDCLRFGALHVLALLIVGAMAATLRRRSRLFPYRHVYRRLNRVLDSLSSTTKRRQASGKASAERWGFSVASAERSLETETPRQDPRSVEQAFLDLLHDMLAPCFALPIPGHLVSMPAPQLTFVFDELDKVGARSSYMVDQTKRSGSPVPGSLADRERSQLLHRLLADMKNLLSVAPARFFFVGGRDLHDEWLADRSARQPLLPNVFDAEIYLPTLFVDPIACERASSLSANTYVYLNARLARSCLLHESWQRRKRGISLFTTVRHHADHAFIQEPITHGPFDRGPDIAEPGTRTHPWYARWRLSFSLEHAPLPDLRSWELFDASTAQKSDAVSWSAQFWENFSDYLAFRSRGNPKGIDALLGTYVRPTGMVVTDPETRWSSFDCQHVLRFDHAQRLSIQFVGSLCRRLGSMVTPRVEHGDDKVVRSAVYLADFLTKFHRRAFAWKSLERIDEVLHMHRAPDLRGILGDIVLDWSQCCLQPILNGMFAFRFRSEHSAEIRYISRCSESEMAAFNFTLDESQALKLEYQRRLEHLTEVRQAAGEVREALGELHDFDEDYEEARRHYAAAIEEIDAQTDRAEKTGLLSRVSEGKQQFATRRHIEWGVQRLRLMLQIGLTYERSRNYEQAIAEYRSAATFARTLWFALLDNYARGADDTVINEEMKASEHPEKTTGRHRLDALKHLSLVYQPLFAAAWIGEKAPSSIDASLTMAEQGLWEIRRRLPFVRLPHVRAGTKSTAHATFALSMADLHHNAGNMYFFKGSQNQRGTRLLGYLDQAQYHYAVALHEVRRLHTHRLTSSTSKFAPTNFGADPSPPIPDDVLPDFALRRATSALFGLANVWLAQVSLNELLDTPVESEHLATLEVAAMHSQSVTWFRSARVSDAGNGRGQEAGLNEDAEDALARWVGHWKGVDPTVSPELDPAAMREEMPRRVVQLFGAHSVSFRLCSYLGFARLGAEILARGGHHEEAAHELLRVAGSIEALLSGLETLHRFDTRSRKQLDPKRTRREPVPGKRPLPDATILLLLQQGRLTLERTDELLRLRFAEQGRQYVAFVPAHAKRLLRTILLALTRHATRLNGSANVHGPLLEIAKSLERLRALWTIGRRRDDAVEKGDDAPQREAHIDERHLAEDGSFEKGPWTWQGLRDSVLKELHEGLELQAYPVLNHLMTLRELILDAHLTRPAPPEEPWRVVAQRAGDDDVLVSELVRLAHDYGSPWHFTPYHVGSAIAVDALDRGGPQDDRLVLALAHLSRSQHTYGSRSAYYEAIANLYYLDDDFNDRCLQIRHATQMMASDLTALLIAKAQQGWRGDVKQLRSDERPPEQGGREQATHSVDQGPRVTSGSAALAGPRAGSAEDRKRRFGEHGIH